MTAVTPASKWPLHHLFRHYLLNLPLQENTWLEIASLLITRAMNRFAAELEVSIRRHRVCETIGCQRYPPSKTHVRVRQGVHGPLLRRNRPSPREGGARRRGCPSSTRRCRPRRRPPRSSRGSTTTWHGGRQGRAWSLRTGWRRPRIRRHGFRIWAAARSAGHKARLSLTDWLYHFFRHYPIWSLQPYSYGLNSWTIFVAWAFPRCMQPRTSSPIVNPYTKPAI